MLTLADFLFVTWNPDPEAFSIGGFSVRWYGILFALAFLSGYLLMGQIFKNEKIESRYLDSLTLWMVGATFIGARLGHCLFYEPEVYLKDPLRILNIREGGLASHGAAIGIILGMWIWSRYVIHKDFRWTLDRMVIFVALSGLFIRGGNLINGEIVGSPTNVPWAFIFQNPSAEDQNPPYLYGTRKGNSIELKMDWEQDALHTKFSLLRKMPPGGSATVIAEIDPNAQRSYTDANLPPGPAEYALVDQASGKPYVTASIIPRHPAQIYEAVFYLCVFLFLLRRYWKKKGNIAQGEFFGIFMVLVFGFRFLVEFFKKNQVEFESGMAFNMGQMLSIPFVIAGLWFWLRANKNEKASSAATD